MPRIVYADDNKNIREYCRRELEEEGYEVVTAHDGGEALRMIGSQPFDLVVLDICMPGIDGLEAVEQIRAVQPDLPIVFFTSFDEICQRDRRADYATACVGKHEDLTELKRVITDALAWRRRATTEGGSRPYRRGLPPTVFSGNRPHRKPQTPECV